jgi:hypothetical protein
MRVHTLFLYQWNNDCNEERKFNDFWTLESLKITIPLNRLHHQLIFLKEGTTIILVNYIKKPNVLYKHRVSSKFSKDWWRRFDLFKGRVSYASELNLNMNYYHIKLDVDDQKPCTIVFPWGKIQIQKLIHVYQDWLLPNVFQSVKDKIVRDVVYV